jgi:hypothetical protein
VSPRTRQILHVAAMPIVAGAIYVWMVRQVMKDIRTVAAQRWWPGPPIDYP